MSLRVGRQQLTLERDVIAQICAFIRKGYFAMNGLNAHTGQPLAGLDHLRQSIADILSTPLNTRVMRRDYGSRLPELIDQPITPRLAVELCARAGVKFMGVLHCQCSVPTR